MIKIETEDFIIITTTTKEGNLALHTQDETAAVIENRLNFFAKIGKQVSNFALANPTHSTRLLQMTDCDRGQGILKLSKYDQYDALYTKESDLFVGIFHADCTPVMLYAPDMRIVCAIHAGFRGAVDGIITKTITSLQENEGIDITRLRVYIMPSISQRNYEISKDMSLEVTNTNAVLKCDDNTYYWDNHTLIREQLLNLGVLTSNITSDSTCTFEDPNFYSYRKDKTIARNLSLIALKQN